MVNSVRTVTPLEIMPMSEISLPGDAISPIKDDTGLDSSRSFPQFRVKTVDDRKPSLDSFRVKTETAVPDECPDGGLRAWLVVLGAACGGVVTFGFINAWGLFQAFYEQEQLQSSSPSNIAWIGSIQYALVYMPGLIFGRLFDHGYLKLPITVASALLITCTFLTAECKEYWQFLLCQGFGIGLASGVVFISTSMAIPHWFKKNLGLALSALASGSSVGGTIIPIILKNLLTAVGFKWALRIMGFIMMAFLAVLILFVQRRLPPKPRAGPFINLSEFKNPTYSVYVLSLILGFLGLYTCLTYITVSGIAAGVDPNLSFYLLSIANATSLFGRLAGGLSADRLGPMNVLIPGTLVTAALTYAWPFAQTKSSLIAVAVLYGISSGMFVALAPQAVVRMGKLTEVGMRTGMAFTFMSFGALAGPPISGAILDSTNEFKNVGFYAGSMLVGSAVTMMVARILVLKGSFAGKA